MKTVQIAVCMFLAAAAPLLFADVESNIAPLTFTLDIGDNAITLPPLIFDNEFTEQAQMSCAMTPGGGLSDVILALPPLPIPDTPYRLSDVAERLEPVTSLISPPLSSDRGTIPPSPRLPEQERIVSVVPAPATIGIVALGVGLICFFARCYYAKT